jgi:NADH:ubiquinone reductase (H+-translocating)
LLGTSIMMNKLRLVVLGAGYAGMTLAAHLDNRISKKDTQIILVDANPYHELIQEAHLVAGGFRKPEDTRIPILDLIKDINIQFIQSFVKKVNADENKVILENSDYINYDYLVVALGASTKFFGIQGAMEYALTLRSIDDGLTIYNKASKLLSKSINDNNNKHELSKGKETKNIVIVGGGATGVGVAGALADLNRDSARSSSEKTKIEIVTASSTVLPGSDARIIDEVGRILHEKGVSIITHITVTEVRRGSILFDDGSEADSRAEIPSSLTIWTPGIKGYDLPVEPQVEKTNNGRIVINDYCQTTRHPNIFCIGDISAIKEASGKIVNTPLGHTAISQAIYLAESIADYFTPKIKPVQKFQSNVNVRILSLGVNDYIGLLNNVVVTGDIARIAKRFKQEAYIESISSGETTFAAKIYKNDPVSSLLSYVYITIFSLSKTLKNKVEVHDSSKINGHNDQNSVTDKVKEFVNKD